MKKALAATLLLGVVILGQVAGASADNPTRMSANIPFAFHAGNKLVPAGEYVFEMTAIGAYSATGTTLAIHNRDGSIFLYVNAILGDVHTFNPAANVTFTRYGGTYFLSEVQSGRIKSCLPKTNHEKELALAYSKESGQGGSKELIEISSFQR
ncbi:MAG TPA: hypothetical protein VE398_22440 [Acidobacteriota bacterium]|nr:hypothetical protein [Acidobacteriota bacterium]